MKFSKEKEIACSDTMKCSKSVRDVTRFSASNQFRACDLHIMLRFLAVLGGAEHVGNGLLTINVCFQ
jgi:hypothetical protein